MPCVRGSMGELGWPRSRRFAKKVQQEIQAQGYRDQTLRRHRLMYSDGQETSGTT